MKLSSSNWWSDVNDSPIWQDRIFNVLAILYGIVSIYSVIHIVRLQLRTPDYGWTTQKVFAFLNFVMHGVRAVVFVFRRNVLNMHSQIMQHILLDIPSLGFFTTYAVLILFWAMIHYQARMMSTDRLKPSFFTINAIVYVVQISLWLVLWWNPIRVMVILFLSKMFLAGVSLFVALGFLLYGGRLLLMLHRFPVESKGRRKKMKEVGCVTTICFTSFLIRCIMVKSKTHTHTDMIMDTQALDEVPEEALIVPEGPMTRSKTRKLAGAVWKVLGNIRNKEEDQLTQCTFTSISFVDSS